MSGPQVSIGYVSCALLLVSSFRPVHTLFSRAISFLSQQLSKTAIGQAYRLSPLDPRENWAANKMRTQAQDYIRVTTRQRYVVYYWHMRVMIELS